MRENNWSSNATRPSTRERKKIVCQEKLGTESSYRMHDTSPRIRKGLARSGAHVRKPRIAFVIPRGEVIRNFVHSGVLDDLKKSAEISLITVQPQSSAELLAQLSDDIHPLDQIAEHRLTEVVREILDMAHGRWLWSRAAQFRWRARDFEAGTVRQKLVRLLKKALCSPFSNRVGLSVLSKIERALSYRLKTTNHYIDLMRKINPDIVFNGSHIHSRNAVQAVQAAQWLGIPTATFIFSWDNLTSQGRIFLPYDHYLVWSDKLKRQLLEMYESVEPSNVHVTGTPQFDFHLRPEFYSSREEFCQRFRIDPNRPIVLYTSGMSNHMPGEPEIVEEIADMLSEYSPESRPQLVVRVYPKDTTGRFDELRERRSDIRFLDVAWDPDWLTPGARDSADLVNTLRHCDLGINIASTISLELCMFDKPVINVGYNPVSVEESNVNFSEYYDFDHYVPVAASGAIEIAWNREQMRLLIANALKSPKTLSAKRKLLISEMFGDSLDGNSGRRVTEVLMRIASEC